MSRTFWIGCLAFAVSAALGIVYPPDRFQSASTRSLPSGLSAAQAVSPSSTGQAAGATQTPLGANNPVSAPATAPPDLPEKGITAVWANEGGDKVTRDELRTVTKKRAVQNSVWNGTEIHLFGARNEVIGFNLVLEAATGGAEAVNVSFDRLDGPNGFQIRSVSPQDSKAVFAWTDRDIELFLVRYLPIAGLSRLSYETYDERHVPERLRLPETSERKLWTDRPDHDKSYPDIAVPLELFQNFSIGARQNQSVWGDIYIPKDAPPGLYSGEIVVRERDAITRRVAVRLQVRRFTLPDIPTAKTMVATSYHDVAKRYTGVAEPQPGSPADELTKRVMDRQMMVAHRHKISLIDDNGGADAWPQDAPRPEWTARLSGTLFTAANGYRGPGEGVGNNVFSIGTYGQWQDWWGPATRASIWARTDKWETWFEQNAPNVERFLYLADESEAYKDLERWAHWLRINPGKGGRIKSFATAELLKAEKLVPSLDITASWFRTGVTQTWQAAVEQLRVGERKQFYLYNGNRPASGSFAVEDDGVALRELAWGQYKKKIDRWFFWSATYYEDYQGGRGPTNVFKDAHTFGGAAKPDPSLGMSGGNYSNGDGVLFYPGTDAAFPAQSYGLDGPIASLRLKYWRRGIQDVDYLALAEKVNPAATKAIVDRIVPKVLWEYGVNDPADPSWVRAPISWSTNPDDWEKARQQLADIIESGARDE